MKSLTAAEYLVVFSGRLEASAKLLVVKKDILLQITKQQPVFLK
jgi:hypothetical protein